MSMVYRAAVNNDGLVVCIGRDENQSGAYHDMGTWCNFTFEAIPQIPSEVMELGLNALRGIPLLKEEAGEIVARTLEEVEADLE